MEAVNGLISDSQYEKLRTWFNGPSRQWRMEAYTRKSKRGSDGAITRDLAPPNSKLKSSAILVDSHVSRNRSLSGTFRGLVTCGGPWVPAFAGTAMKIQLQSITL